MESRWSDSEAKTFVDRYARDGIASDLALRVYTTRLLGQDARLVLHGGGNTSVKTRVADLLGEEADVLCVKCSGWDMAQIEPAGLPAVRLAALRKLRERETVSVTGVFSKTDRDTLWKYLETIEKQGRKQADE